MAGEQSETQRPLRILLAKAGLDGRDRGVHVIAAALRDQRNAKVVGMRSAGAALASTMRQLRDGYMLQFPLMDYVTIKGLRIEGTGVEPDVVAPNLRFGEKDIGVAEAIRIFKESRDGSIAA
ncbi:MAG: hypothetical protein IIA41_07150 [SAR324 cluster bacterium]|nr:hypothetical protein [SAR324 cluster bacterium]